MNENINLCELLKSHEGETFYYAVRDSYVILNKILNDYYICVEDKESPNLLGCLPSIKSSFVLYSDGSFCKNGFCVLFPSKGQRNWNKWAEEQKPKVPKTWNEYIKLDDIYTLPYILRYNRESGENEIPYENDLSPIENAALALLKIHQLIKIGYGGNITNEEWNKSDMCKYSIKCIKNHLKGQIEYTVKSFVAFHTKEQRDEFLSYPENVQLLKDFYMI